MLSDTEQLFGAEASAVLSITTKRMAVLTENDTSHTRLLKKVLRHPSRAILRLILKARLARHDLQEARLRLLAFLTEHFDVDAHALLREYQRSEFSRWHHCRLAELDRLPGPRRLGTTGPFGCEALYLLVRAVRPRVVIETGVLYGASSGHILAALARNGEGELHSIELGRDSREPPHDFLIPKALQSQWDLIIGDSRLELPSLLEHLPEVNLFHHDSLHTFEHMKWEYEAVFPHLTPEGVLSSHDVVTAESLRHLFRKNAFPDFCERSVTHWATFKNFGIALKGVRGTCQQNLPQFDFWTCL
jgi:hypothetical protein